MKKSEARRLASPIRKAATRRVIRGILLCGALGAIGLLVAASGIIPITASSGHWAATRWFLEFSKERSVATHSLALRAPATLDRPSLIFKGARHYETGCRPCHGSPGLAPPRIAGAMLPPPPSLDSASSDWTARELFYIVKHGVKMTGMPAWPAQERDDEVWAVVAFLRELPRLDEAGYRRLASGVYASEEGEPMEDLLPLRGALRAIVESCARCHGRDGAGRGEGAFPRLAGQKPEYLLGSLRAYSLGERHSGMMEPVAAGLSPETMLALTSYYAGLPEPPGPALEAEAAERIARGKKIAMEGAPSQRAPACAACHGPGPTLRNPAYPSLAGQHAEYLTLQLELFAKGSRGGTKYSHLMHFAASQMNVQQMEDVALYYSSLVSAEDTDN